LKLHLRVAAFLSFCLLGALCCPAQETSPDVEPVPGSYSIHGTLRLAADTRGVSMVRVELRRVGGELVTSTFTDSNGDFHFFGLTRGHYVVAVDEEGYESIRDNVDLTTVARTGMALYLKRSSQAGPPEQGSAVSVRELHISRKARDAFRKGMEQFYDKKVPQAGLPYFQRAIAEFPGYYEAYYQSGLAYLEMGRLEEAQQVLRKAIEVSEKRYAQAYLLLGSILSKQEKYAEAEELIRHGLQLDATAWQGYYELARLLFSQNRVDEAERSAAQTRLRKPDFAPTYLLLVNIHLRKRDYPSVMKELDEYLRLDPDGPLSSKAREMRDQLQRALAQGQAAATPNTTKP